MKSWIASLTWGFVVAASFLGEAQAQIAFDKLTACDDVARTWRRLDAAAAWGCRAPAGAIERELAARAFPMGNACFIREEIAPMASGFSCIATPDARYHTARGLLCVRETDGAAVARYEDDYDARYATTALQYVADAAKCDGFAGDAAPVGASLVSPYVQHIAAPRFAFAAQRGGARSGLVVHGYAALDPTIAGGSRAIEIIEFGVGGVIAFGTNARGNRHGEWRLSIDAAEELDTQLNDAYAKLNFPARVDFTDYEIDRQTTSRESATGRARRMDSWAKIAADGLELEGFEFVDDARLQQESGMSYAKMREQMIARMPYGQRAQMDARTGGFRMFLDDILADCTDNDQGALIGMVITSVSPRSFGREYGSVGVVVMGLGACSRPFAMRKASDLIEQITDDLEYALENES